MNKTVIEQAIEALGSTDSEHGSEAWEREKEAMIALEKLAEQPAPAQESAAMRDAIVVNLVHEGVSKHRARAVANHILATTPQAQRNPLTEEEIRKAVNANKDYWASSKLFIIGIARAIEAARNIKENT